MKILVDMGLSPAWRTTFEEKGIQATHWSAVGDEAWKAALARAPRATFKLYPELFHLFMPSSTPGAGLGSPADYERPGHVAAPVIGDIAGWIGTATPRQEDRR